MQRSTLIACTVISHKTDHRVVVLDHHTFRRQKLITRRSPQQPTVYLKARSHTKDYEELGYRLQTRTRQITIAMTADTGSHYVPVRIKIHRLDFKNSDLSPVKIKMSALNRDVTFFLGAFILRLSGNSRSGKHTAHICCPRRDRRCILDLGSLYNIEKHPE